MRRSISLILAAVAAAAVSAVPVQAGAAPGKSQADEHRRVVEYWTAARRASAVPRDVAPKHMAKPGGGGGGGGTGSTTVTGATWTKGGDVAKTTGKVFFNVGASRYVCSASAVDSPHGNLVLTAGHCVHDGNGGAFVTNWIFYPGWNGAPSSTLGTWTATKLFTTAMWANASDGFDDDAGFAVVTGGANSPTLEQKLGQNGAATPTMSFDGASTTDTYSAFGYPASKRYRGNTLTTARGW